MERLKVFPFLLTVVAPITNTGEKVSFAAATFEGL